MAGADGLAVVIPTFQRSSILARTLDALAAQSESGFEVVVVVDGENQAPIDLPDPKWRCLQLGRHGGPAAARNVGVAATDRPIVLFLGDDMIPDPTLVAGHLAAHRSHFRPEDAVLGHVEWHDDVPRNSVIRWIDRSGTQFDYANIVGDEAGWGRFYSCNVSLKREFFLLAGGFDEEFAFDYEDLDLAFRLHEKGLRLWYERSAVARHLHSYDLGALARRYRSKGSAERVMASKHPWFRPFFERRVTEADSRRRVSALWLLAEQLKPSSAPDSTVGRRVDTWFNQQLATEFLSSWEGEEDLNELKQYLGSEFDRQLLWGHRQAVEEEERSAPDEASFYGTSRMYLYDLTAFAMSGVKRPYLAALQCIVPPGTRLLDYGCGIGTDGLRLLANGYRVEFADFDNPSVAYLRWRLARRGIDAPIHDVTAEVPGGFDAAIAFDVLEHVDNPFDFLAQLESRAGIVAVNILEPDPDDTHLHRPLPVRALIAHATRRGLLHYRKYHRNSHFVIYTASASNRAASLAQLMAGGIARARRGMRTRLASSLVR